MTLHYSSCHNTVAGGFFSLTESFLLPLWRGKI
jgi:hypothetical protein